MHFTPTDSRVLGKYHAPVTSGVSAMEGEPVTPQEIAEHRVAMGTLELMTATMALSELAASKTNAPLVKRELNDIELAYTRLGRMLSRLRMEQVNA